MAQKHACSRCGSALDDSTPDGYCLSCLLREGLEDSAEVKSSGAGQRFGNYELLKKIGQGGMGVVYRARQINLNRVVAVKLLPFSQFTSAEAVQRFQAEASAAAGLQHPNIVAIHEVGEHEGQHYFSMDFIEGRTLAEIVREQPLPAKRAASYVKTIAEAVHYAHQHGILHRDLKPSNILMDAADQPHITDFGLAKRLVVPPSGGWSGPAPAKAGTTNELTISGQVLGSPNFMSPEQAAGRPQTIGPGTDVYALGAILYHLLTRQPPFQADTLTTLLKQVAEAEPVSPRRLNPSIPRDLETICLKCLEKEPARRYSSAQALAEDLGRFLENKTILARPVNAVGQAWKWCRRRPALAGVSVALVLTSVVGFTGVLWQWRHARQNAQAELRQRERAEAGEYAADMHLAQLALADNNRGLAVNLLNKYRPEARTKNESRNREETDLRGWEWRYLWRLCQGDELVRLHRCPRAINTVAVSKDGQVLAVATWDEVTLWDLTSRRPLTEFHHGTWALAFSPAEARLALGAWDSKGRPTVEVWNLNAGKVIKTMGQAARSRSLAFSPDGRLLAIFDSRGAVQVTDWMSDQVFTNFTVSCPRYGPAGVVAFSPDGKWLGIGEDYGPVRLLDLRTGQFVFLPVDLGAGVTSLAFSPTGKLLAAGFGYNSGRICILDTRSGERLGQFTNHTGDVSGLAFTPDDRQLISSSGDGTIRVWDVAERAEIRRLSSSGEGLTSLAALPDGHTLVTGDNGGLLCLWDFTTHQPRFVHTNLTVGLGFASLTAPDGDSNARAAAGPAARRLGLAFTANSQQVLTTDPDGTLALWGITPFRLAERLTALGSNHWGLAVSPDGRWLAAGSTSGKLTIWDWAARRAITNFTVSCEWFGRLRFSPSGRFLLCITYDNGLKSSPRIWQTTDWSEASLSGITSDACLSLDLSPDDHHLAAGWANGAVMLFEFPSGRVEFAFTNHYSQVAEVGFSPDGGSFFSTSLDGSVRIWDLSGQKASTELANHLGMLCGGTFLPDGLRLATGGERPKDAVRVWNRVAKREVLSLPGAGAYFMQVVSSPDGNLLGAVSLDGTAHLWRAPSWAEIAAAERGTTKP